MCQWARSNEWVSDAITVIALHITLDLQTNIWCTFVHASKNKLKLVTTNKHYLRAFTGNIIFGKYYMFTNPKTWHDGISQFTTTDGLGHLFNDHPYKVTSKQSPNDVCSIVFTFIYFLEGGHLIGVKLY